MRRVLTAVAIVAAIVLPMASPASATLPPTVVRFPKGTFDLGNLNDGPAGDVCPFPVDVVVKSMGGLAILFAGQGVAYEGFGAGAYQLTITNMDDTRKSVVVNSSGPGGLTADGSVVIGRGPWTTFEPIAEGGIRYMRGVISYAPVSYGLHATVLAGIEEDLCDRVA
jgi:hypothetical protein